MLFVSAKPLPKGVESDVSLERMEVVLELSLVMAALWEFDLPDCRISLSLLESWFWSPERPSTPSIALATGMGRSGRERSIVPSRSILF